MPSYNRHVEPGERSVYHVMCRTALRARLLDERAREKFVTLMWRQARFCGVEVLSYCVLSNHFHLLVRVPAAGTPVSNETLLGRYRALYGDGRVPFSAVSPERLEEYLKRDDAEAEQVRARLLARMHDLSVFVRELKQRFSIWYNRNRGNHGTIWAERFKSVLVENEAFALRMVGGYIDLNPVRAGICQDPARYRWCSYAAAMAGSELERRAIQEMTGREEWARAVADYRVYLFFRGRGEKAGGSGVTDREQTRRILEREGEVAPAEVLQCRIRHMTQGAILGSSEYIERVVREHKEWVGKRRRRVAHRVPGLGGSGLYSLRDLRVRG